MTLDPNSPSSSLSTERERRIRAFKRWMCSNSIDFSDALSFSADSAAAVSVTALCPLSVGDLVATIPKLACLTVKTSAARDIIEAAGLDGSLALSVALMFERSLGCRSTWSGYLQLLPEREPVPLLWTSDEIDRFLIGTELHKIVKEDQAFIHEDWKEHIEPLKLDPEHFGVEQYFSAKSLVSSRSFEVDDYHGYGMVPLADLFNHKTEAENVHFTNSSPESDDEDHSDISTASDEGDDSTNSYDDPTTLEMIVVREVEAGAEVFNTYGVMGNAALLHRYGFTEPDNTFDIVNIDLDLVLKWSSTTFSNRYSRARLSLWRRLNFCGCSSQNSEYFEISFNGEPQIELLVLLYIMFLPENAYDKLNCMIDSFSEADETTNLMKLAKLSNIKCSSAPDNIEFLLTKDACNALLSLADMRESLYGSKSLENEKKKLRRCCPMKERKLYHSLVLRVSERNILARLRQYASKGSKAKKRKALSI